MSGESSHFPKTQLFSWLMFLHVWYKWCSRIKIVQFSKSILKNKEDSIGVCWPSSCSWRTDLVFKLVGIFVLLLVQIDEVMSDAFFVPWLHVPADLEGVTCDVADLNVLRDRKLLHLRDTAVLGFTSCVVKNKRILINHIVVFTLSNRLHLHSYIYSNFPII